MATAFNALKHSIDLTYGSFGYHSALPNSQFAIDARQVLMVPPPVGLAVTTTGTTGSTTRGYQVWGILRDGSITSACTEVQKTDGYTSLSSSKYQVVAWYPISNADVIQYVVFRTTAGGTPNTTGVIATINADAADNAVWNGSKYYYNDVGAAGDETSVLTGNTEGRMSASQSHRFAMQNNSSTIAILGFFSTAPNSTQAGIEAAAAFSAGYDGTTKIGKIFRVGAGGSCDFLTVQPFTFVYLVTESSTVPCHWYIGRS